MEQKELDQILKDHQDWLNGADTGKHANLSSLNFKNVNLEGANLEGANLIGANLEGANLEGANLKYANLKGANLYKANLIGANLEGANLEGANLDFSSLPLWCGSKNIIIDDRIGKQLVAHVLNLLEYNNLATKTLRKNMTSYKKGWHREAEF